MLRTSKAKSARIADIFLFFILFFGIITSAHAKNGIYTTFDTGVAQQTGLPTASQVGATNSESESFPSAFRFAVGYNHDLYESLGIGLDVAYGRYGKQTYTYSTGDMYVRTRTLEIAALLQWHVNSQWDVIGKLGGLRQTSQISGVNAQSNETLISPEISVGAAYNFTQHVAATMTYAHVFGDQMSTLDDLANKVPSLNEFLIGLRYTF